MELFNLYTLVTAVGCRVAFQHRTMERHFRRDCYCVAVCVCVWFNDIPLQTQGAYYDYASAAGPFERLCATHRDYNTYNVQTYALNAVRLMPMATLRNAQE